jgi:hypothetical protein
LKCVAGAVGSEAVVTIEAAGIVRLESAAEPFIAGEGIIAVELMSDEA